MTGELKGKTDDFLKSERKKAEETLRAIDMEIAARDKARREKALHYLAGEENILKENLNNCQRLMRKIREGGYLTDEKTELDYYIHNGKYSK